jgi:hypothetical protein
VAQIATVGLVGGFREVGAIGTPEEPAGFRPIPEVETTKHTKHTKTTGCKQTYAAQIAPWLFAPIEPQFSCASCVLWFLLRRVELRCRRVP